MPTDVEGRSLGFNCYGSKKMYFFVVQKRRRCSVAMRFKVILTRLVTFAVHVTMGGTANLQELEASSGNCEAN